MTRFGAKWWLVSPSGSDVTASVSSFTASGSGAGAAPAAPASSTASRSDASMTTFLARMRGSGQTRPEGGATLLAGTTCRTDHRDLTSDRFLTA